MKNFWKELLKEKFISQEKYNRLVCEEHFTDSELAEFIDRQLVETRQVSKAILNLFQNICPKTKTKIKTIKAELISGFRQKFKLYKSRELNDFHHAQDAYLSIVVGNVYDEKFASNSKIFIEKYKNAKHEKYHMKNIFNYDVKRNGNIAWIAEGNEKTFNTVEKVIDKNSPLVTRRAFEQTGKLFDATICGKNVAKKEGYIAIKTSDERLQNVNKYGGYSSIKAAYFFLSNTMKKNVL